MRVYSRFCYSSFGTGGNIWTPDDDDEIFEEQEFISVFWDASLLRG